MKSYPSDITEEQFAHIRPLLEGAKKRTAPRKVDLLRIFNAVLYVLKEGCRWRSLPHDYPDWELVYYYFSVWKTPKKTGTQAVPQNPAPQKTLLEEVLKKIGWKGETKQWSEREHHLSHSRRTEC